MKPLILLAKAMVAMTWQLKVALESKQTPKFLTLLILEIKNLSKK